MFGKLLTNQKIAHKIVKPYVYKALREGLKTHDNGKIQNLRGFGSLSLRFTRLKEARDFALAWVWMYNNERPHESLGYLPPVQFAQQRLRSEAPASLLTDYPNQWKSLILNVNN